MIQSNGLPHEQVNPPYTPYMWMDLTSGEIFVCIDNTRDANIWMGQNDTSVLGPIRTNNLIYKQGEFTGGNATDISGNGNDITVSGGSASTYLGMPGVYLDGSTNTVGMGEVDFTDFSISFWYKPNTNTTLYRWLSIGNWNDLGSLVLYNSSSVGMVGGTVLPNDDNQINVNSVNHMSGSKLDHIVYTRSADNTKIYLNGILKNSTTRVISPTQQVTGTLTIGDNSSSAKGWFAGLRIYDACINNDGVLALYNEPVKMW